MGVNIPRHALAGLFDNQVYTDCKPELAAKNVQPMRCRKQDSAARH